MIGNLLLIFVVTFTIYILIRMAKSRDSQKESYQKNTLYSRMCLAGILGFIVGFVTAFLVNPPYKGIWETSNDVQGLVIASWFGGGGLGAVLFTLASLFKRKTTN